MRIIFFAAVLGLPFFGLKAQTTFQEQAARLQNINGYLLDFRPASAPHISEKRFELALDVNVRPDVDTTVGLKNEPVDPPALVPRLRGRWHFKNGVFVGGAWAPGVEMKGYEADFISLESGFRFALKDWAFSLRGSYSEGTNTGPMTEPDTNDIFDFEATGLDISAGRDIGVFRAYGFLGVNDLNTKLDITSDSVILRNADSAMYGGLGISWQARSFVVNLEQNFTDDYLRHVTATVTYAF